MSAILALLPSLISLIPTIGAGITNLISFIEGVRTAAQQAAEWTPDLEAAFVNALIARAKSQAWLPDSVVMPQAAPVVVPAASATVTTTTQVS